MVRGAERMGRGGERGEEEGEGKRRRVRGRGGG